MFPFTVHPPTSFGSPPEFDETSPTARRRRPAVPPMRFLASSRHQHAGSAVTMVSTPPPPSARRFSQPLGGLLPFIPCRLVSSRKHVQASPFRVFPSPGAVTARRRDLALLPLPRAGLPCGRPARSSTSGPCSPGESVASGPRLSEPDTRSPHGLLVLSRACFTPAVDRVPTILPSRACLTPVRDGCFGAPQGLVDRRMGRLSRDLQPS